MKKALAWLLVLSMTAALAVGGTLAYLTDTDEDVNVMTVGKVRIDQLEYERVDDEKTGDEADVQEFHNNKPLYPAVTEDGFNWDTTNGSVSWDQIGKDGYDSGIWNPDDINNEQDKMVFVKNKGDFDAYVRTVFAFEAGSYETLEEYLADVHFNLNDTDWTWQWSEPPVTIGGGEYFIATATYNKILEPGKLTEISLSQIALDPSVTNEDVAGFGETYQVLAQSQAVQADGFESAPIALAEAFGSPVYDGAQDEIPPFEVQPDDVPFEDDNPVEGTDVRTAIHYLNGNSAHEKITAKVSSVTFGLNKDYADIVDTYDGTLVDVEQDVPVYAYYVPKGDTYEVYMLANDDIYAPESCYELFYNGEKMAKLTNLDFSNFNTSRTTVMSRMFRDVNALKTLDLSGFDTSNVTAMDYIFYRMLALESVDVSDWNTKNVTNLSNAFYRCSALKKLDLSGWDVSNVTTTQSAFYQCGALTSIGNLSNWDLSNAKIIKHMFYQCTSLKELTGTQNWGLENVTDMMSIFHTCSAMTKLEGEEMWKLGKVQDASYSFYGANKLTELSVADWDMSNATTTFAMFYGAASLEYLDVADWETGNVTNMAGMFSDCTNLGNLDVADWDTGKVTEMYLMFARCPKMTEVLIDNWDVSNVVAMRLMFDGDTSLVTLGCSNWNTGNVQQFTAMFQGCNSLKNIDVSKWDLSSAWDLAHMFAGCVSLEELDVSDWNVSNVTHFNAMFQGGGSNTFDMKLKHLDVSKWNPVSAVYMNHMFYGCSKLTELDMSGWNMPNLYTTSHMLADCSGLLNLDVSGWQTTDSWYSMDAMFNDCRSVKTIDVSSWNTSGIVEFSQTFEACWALEGIVGLENWDTSSGKSFDETFLSCGSLKELNLSSWDTSSARYGNKHLNGDTSAGFRSTFSGCNNLQKLILGENFDFDGNGTVSHTCSLPNPGKIDGQTTVWYNAENDTYYAASEIPDETVATYIAVVKP